MSENILIQAAIVGYAGSPKTLYSVYNPGIGILAISRLGSFNPVRRPHTALVTNDAAVDDRDSLFTENDLHDAIDAYFSLLHSRTKDGHSSRLTYSQEISVGSVSPESRIERESIDVNGSKYRIAGDISCAQIACLATCLFAQHSDAVVASEKMFDDLNAFLSQGGVYTI